MLGMTDEGVIPRHVLDAFGLTGPVDHLSGGEGQSVRVGSVVLKPAEDGDETNWAAALLSRLDEDGFRIARPVRARDGRWVVAGWCASRLVAGETGPAGRWPLLLAAARAFHAALLPTPCPAFLERRTHRWALADRVAWGEASFEPLPTVQPLMDRLTAVRRAVSARRCQLVHGDLSGNVLFADGLAPAIIDFSPYWRPAAYADAIIAVDGLLWHAADRGLLTLAGTSPEFPQLLVRALIFRLVAHNEQARLPGAALDELTEFETVVAEVESLANGVRAS
jgi:uncharacterized protein (TIGR02569 family)